MSRAGEWIRERWELVGLRLSPNGNLRQDPVIVVGMHNSGTSILARALIQNGIFMNPTMDHAESKLFTLYLHENRILGKKQWASLPLLSIDHVRHYEPLIRQFIDRYAYRYYIRHGYDGVGLWGFKDPRTAVLMPVYTTIFPEGYFIHIHRNPQRLAEGLSARRKAGLDQPLSVEQGMQLNQAYVDRIREFGAKIPRFLEISYEEFCIDPVTEFAKICRFLSVKLKPDTTDFLRDTVRTDRI